MADLAWPSTTHRSSNGCWTCRLRRKKCDENGPICKNCAFLRIKCIYSPEKPDFVDGGPKQDAMVEQIKREIKEQAPYRPRRDRGHTTIPETQQNTPSPLNGHQKTTPDNLPEESSAITAAAVCDQVRQIRPFDRSHSVLFMFHLDHVLPFLFPFYQPSLLEGGKAWILDLVVSSPVFRQAALCQSSYFFALAHGTTDHEMVWETMLSQSRDAFQVLRQAIDVLEHGGMVDHMHGAARVMAAVMQLQRFEIAVSSFDNCRAHLSASLAIFTQLLDSTSRGDMSPAVRFRNVVNKLGPSLWVSTSQQMSVLSTEQAAFCFSSALLIFDDIIASTFFQERPRLYDYHRGLLYDAEDSATDTPIKLETVTGCQNCVLVQIAEIAALDTWKQNSKQVGALDVMELVHRATTIKNILEADMVRLENEPIHRSDSNGGFLQSGMILTTHFDQQRSTTSEQRRVITLVWTHAALVYLSLVVSEWQPANPEIRHHVAMVLNLTAHHLSPSTLLRTIVWPFCVIGCLAEPTDEAQIRTMVNALQPSSVFGPILRALNVMENVWRDRAMGTAGEFASYFRSQGDLMLLV